jgi:hypothetical protein
MIGLLILLTHIVHNGLAQDVFFGRAFGPMVSQVSRPFTQTIPLTRSVQTYGFVRRNVNQFAQTVAQPVTFAQTTQSSFTRVPGFSQTPGFGQTFPITSTTVNSGTGTVPFGNLPNAVSQPFQTNTSTSSSSLSINSQSTDSMFPEQPLDNTEVRNAKMVLSRSRATTVSEMTPEEQAAFQTLHQAFITRGLIAKHRAWHGANSIGGTRGAGSGTILLGMHLQMLRDFELFVDPTGQWRTPYWDETTELSSIFTVSPRFQGVARSGIRNMNPRLQISAFFTTPGRGAGDSMYDFTTLESVGEAMGLQMHNNGHQMSPEMLDSSISPTDPCFYLWHSYVRYLTDRWIASPNGQRWVAQHPTHPYVTGQGDFSSPALYTNDGECGRSSQSPACQWLNNMQQLVNPTFA